MWARARSAENVDRLQNLNWFNKSQVSKKKKKDGKWVDDRWGEEEGWNNRDEDRRSEYKKIMQLK